MVRAISFNIVISVYLRKKGLALLKLYLEKSRWRSSLLVKKMLLLNHCLYIFLYVYACVYIIIEIYIYIYEEYFDRGYVFL